MSYCIRLAAGFLSAAILASSSALAHGIGERYDLPVPLWLWLTGGGIAIAASFVIASIAMKRASAAPEEERADVSTSLAGRLLMRPWLRVTAAWCALVLLVLVVVAGFIGDQT